MSSIRSLIEWLLETDITSVATLNEQRLFYGKNRYYTVIHQSNTGALATYSRTNTRVYGGNWPLRERLVGLGCTNVVVVSVCTASGLS